MEKTKIDWADSTWNPVTGCYHGCEYCYARNMVKRFSPIWFEIEPNSSRKNILVQDEPYIGGNGRKQPYPWGFLPTFHRYRLDDYKNKKGRTVFVCSMADLFGDWIPDEWIDEVFETCKAAPQHRYLFLTKNPGRYCDLHRKGILVEDDNFWYGATFDHSNWNHEYIPGRPTTFSLQGKRVHDAGDWWFPAHPEKNRFVSFEPLLYDIGECIGSTGGQWHIIGAETGNREGRVIPKKEWVGHIVEYSDARGIPVFMKESLRELMGDEFRQDFPWKERSEVK